MLNYQVIADNIQEIIIGSGYVPNDLKDLMACAKGQREGYGFRAPLYFTREVAVRTWKITQTVTLDVQGMAHLQTSVLAGDLREARAQAQALTEALAFMEALQDLPGVRMRGADLTEAAIELLKQVFRNEETVKVTEDNRHLAQELEHEGAVRVHRAGDSRVGTDYEYLSITSFGYELGEIMCRETS